MASQQSDRSVSNLDGARESLGARVLIAFAAVAVIAFGVGIVAGGIGGDVRPPTGPAGIIEALRHWSASSFVIVSVLIVLVAPYGAMLAVAAGESPSRRTRLAFAIGTLSLALGSLIAAWIAK